MMIQDYFYDTEFHEDGPTRPVELISIGVKRRRAGQLYYAISSEFDMHRAWHNPGPNGDYWLRNNVLMQLPLMKLQDGTIWLDGHKTPVLDYNNPAVKSRGQIRQDLEQFLELGDRIKRRLWAWYADYDHVVLSQLWGTMSQLPAGMPMFTHDLKQIVDLAGNPPMPQQKIGEHNALSDAEHVHTMFVHCMNMGILGNLPISEPESPITRRPILDNPQA